MKGRPAGAWITRKNDQAILTLVSGTTDDAVTVTLADSSGRVIVQGTADGDIIAAKINRGRDGVARCELDPMAVRPAFRFTCTLAEGDPWAWIEVLTQHPSDYALVSSRALVIARRDLTTALQLTTNAPGAEGDPERVILDGLNRVRQGAKLGALTLASKQSATNARLAPHFFRASLEHDRTSGDDIARGLVAGWDVGTSKVARSASEAASGRRSQGRRARRAGSTLRSKRRSVEPCCFGLTRRRSRSG